MLRLSRAVLVSTLAVLAACSGSGAGAAADTTVLVGALDGTDGLIAVARSGDRVTAYACGGPTTVTTSTGWFVATLEAGQATFSVERPDGLVLSGAFDAQGASGSLTRADGSTTAWTARSDDGAPSGLWVGPDGPCVTGAVVMTGKDGATIGVGAWCDGAGKIGQVVPVHPILDDALGLGVRFDTDPATAPVTWLHRFEFP